MDPVGYKNYHERQMMFNSGTTKQECASLIVAIPFSVLFLLNTTSVVPRKFLPVYEFLLIILPTILSVTIFSDINHILHLIWVVMNLAIVLTTSNLKDIKQVLNSEIGDIRSIVTNYRASTNFVSAICILAVDFKIFPRRFAKTESFGFGLMDLGVGFFVCSHGLVEKNQKQRHFSKTLNSFTTLFMLGLIRMIVTKFIGYQEHITEYGIHWNFFLTLAFLKVIIYLTKSLTGLNSTYLALLTGFTHEIGLKIGLRDWVLSETPRDNIISANREGIVSLFGYVCIYFSAQTIGNILRDLNKFTYKKSLTNLIILWFLLLMSTSFALNIFGISRRLVNLGYILWTIFLTLTVVVLFLIAKLIIVSKSKSNICKAPYLFESINANGMFFFIFSNLLTGLVNSVFQTFLLEKAVSLIIVIVYMGILCCVTHYLYSHNIFLKLH